MRSHNGRPWSTSYRDGRARHTPAPEGAAPPAQGAHVHSPLCPCRACWNRGYLRVPRTFKCLLGPSECLERGHGTWPPQGGHLWPPSGAISKFPRHVTDKNVHNQGVIVVMCGQISKYGNISKNIDLRRFSVLGTPGCLHLVGQNRGVHS